MLTTKPPGDVRSLRQALPGGGTVSATLDEKGFVFLDDSARPFLCRIWDGRPWLFNWHVDHWVRLRPTTPERAAQIPRNLSADEQADYHRRHEEYVAKKGVNL